VNKNGVYPERKVFVSGPYGGPHRKRAYEEAIRLRRLGYGHGSIAKRVNVPWKTVLDWVHHIPVDVRAAHELAMRERRPTVIA
jgi:transposase-like protein